MNKLIWRCTIVSCLLLFSSTALTTDSLRPEPDDPQPGSFLRHISPAAPLIESQEQETAAQQIDLRRSPASEPMVDGLLRSDLLQRFAISDPSPLTEPSVKIVDGRQSVLAAEVAEEPSPWLCCPGWIIDIFGSAAFGDQQGELYGIHGSFETLFWEKLSMAWQPFAGVGAGKNDTSGVIGLDLILKYPILTFGPMAVNVEGGGGIQQAGSDSWPRDGSHFNWRPQIGVGVRIDAGEDQTLLFGARWIHVSNGGINDESNSGVDSIMLYGGLQLCF